MAFLWKRREFNFLRKFNFLFGLTVFIVRLRQCDGYSVNSDSVWGSGFRGKSIATGSQGKDADSLPGTTVSKSNQAAEEDGGITVTAEETNRSTKGPEEPGGSTATVTERKDEVGNEEQVGSEEQVGRGDKAGVESDKQVASEDDQQIRVEDEQAGNEKKQETEAKNERSIESSLSSDNHDDKKKDTEQQTARRSERQRIHHPSKNHDDAERQTTRRPSKQHPSKNHPSEQGKSHHPAQVFGIGALAGVVVSMLFYSWKKRGECLFEFLTGRKFHLDNNRLTENNACNSDSAGTTAGNERNIVPSESASESLDMNSDSAESLSDDVFFDAEVESLSDVRSDRLVVDIRSDRLVTPRSDRLVTPRSDRLVTPRSDRLVVDIRSDRLVTPRSDRLVTPRSDRLVTPRSDRLVSSDRLLSPEQMSPEEIFESVQDLVDFNGGSNRGNSASTASGSRFATEGFGNGDDDANGDDANRNSATPAGTHALRINETQSVTPLRLPPQPLRRTSQLRYLMTRSLTRSASDPNVTALHSSSSTPSVRSEDRNNRARDDMNIETSSSRLARYRDLYCGCHHRDSIVLLSRNGSVSRNSDSSEVCGIDYDDCNQESAGESADEHHDVVGSSERNVVFERKPPSCCRFFVEQRGPDMRLHTSSTPEADTHVRVLPRTFRVAAPRVRLSNSSLLRSTRLPNTNSLKTGMTQRARLLPVRRSQP